MSEKVTVTCIDCGTQWEISKKSYNAYTTGYKKYKNHQWRCTKCSFKYHTATRSEAQHKRWEKLSPDEKQNALKPFIDGKAKFYSNMDDDKWKKFGEKVRQGQQSMSADKKEKMLANRGIERKNAWDKVSEADRKQLMEYAHDKSKEWWANLSDEERQQRLDFLHDNAKRWRNNLSEEDREKKNINLNNALRNYWNNINDENKAERLNILYSGRDKWWNNASEEVKNEYYERGRKLTNYHKVWWDGLTDDERGSFIKKVIGSKGPNKLHLKFEHKIEESSIYSKVFLVPEMLLINVVNHTTYSHHWDYGIFDDNCNLIMVVDLDGERYHADNEEYNGMHSKEWYDERRYLSLPDKVKFCFIPENNFDKGFKYMEHLMTITFDQYCDELYRELRSQPFPIPSYTDIELMKSYNRLQRMKINDKYHQSMSLETRQGDWLVLRFHQSIWYEHRIGELSPYDVWKDDNIMKKMIQSHQIYHNHINQNKILQGLNSIRVRFMSAAKAKMIINKYLSEYDTIFDPFSGYSGRMLGTISLGKKYIGQDISKQRVLESNNMMGFLKAYGIECTAKVIQKNIINSSGKYQCLFTSPPYADEGYLDTVTYEYSCDDWIDICLENFKCNIYVFVVNYTEKYKDFIKDELVNKSYYLSNEYLVVIHGK